LYLNVTPVASAAMRLRQAQPAVGDRDPMGVAGQIGQHLLGPGERPLAIDEPLGPMQWREIGLERSLVGEVGVIAEETQAAGVVGGDQHLQHQGAEQPRQDFNWQEIFGTAADPPCAVERYPATRHDHVDMRVMAPTPTIP
jgi:hypothetical protein